MALSSNQYALKVQTLDKILAHKAAPKVPEWPSYGIFRKVTQYPHFLKKYKGEEHIWKAQKHSSANGIIL